MRIFIIIDETVFFHPQFLEDFLKRTKDEVVGACLVTKISSKNNVELDMIKRFYNLYPSEIIKLGYRKVLFSFLNLLPLKKNYTVKSVLVNYSVPYMDTEYNINDEKYVDFIRSTTPDIIVSSQSLYLGKKILNIPNICCINRHSGLLPRNGGLWPCFQAVRKGEKETGVSIHLMTSKIDDGDVLVQKRVEIKPYESLWDIYRECFIVSVDALLECLDKIRNDDFSVIVNGYAKEYYSFPTQKQWREFRNHNGRYI